MAIHRVYSFSCPVVRSQVTANSPENPISERAQHFLKVLIERYIEDGHPVGSRTLAKDAGLDLMDQFWDDAKLEG